MAEASFQAYDLDVATVAGPACAAVMRTAVKTIEQRLDDPTQVAAVKALFGASDINDPIDFLYVVADMGAIPVQYGFKDVFCNQLTAAGADPVQAYATAGKQAFQIFGITPIQDTPQFAMDTNPADYPDIGMRSWTYQTCVEYGYFQDAYSDPTVSVRSSRINQAYDAQVCQRLFGMNGPNIAATNTTYYQPLLDPAKTSNIFFTNGSTDPWSKLGITQENGNLTNPNVAADLIDGGSHCSDLGPPTSTGLDGAHDRRGPRSKPCWPSGGNLGFHWDLGKPNPRTKLRLIIVIMSKHGGRSLTQGSRSGFSRYPFRCSRAGLRAPMAPSSSTWLFTAGFCIRRASPSRRGWIALLSRYCRLARHS